MDKPAGLQEGRNLSELSTWGIGGPARYYIEVHTIEDIQTILHWCKEQKLPYLILGKGSNCLFHDKGFNGVVIGNRLDFFEQPEAGVFHVGAGYSFSLLGVQTARQGWSGLEFACGIPGSVGGAVYMNAGANGTETAQTLITVDFLSVEGELIVLKHSDIEFRYRYSSFHVKPGAIVGATFQLSPSHSARQKQIDLIHYRKKTQPYGSKSAGCVFRNPSSKSAGALIDQSGLKGCTIGGAQVSDLHANFVINTGTATRQDVLALLDYIQQRVQQTTGIELQREVCCIPYDPLIKEDT